MKRLIIAFIAIALSNFSIQAQTDSLLDYIYIDSIDVIHYGVPLKNPWSGGLNAPQYSSIDLNFDGHLDLFVFDPYAMAYKTYLNDGISGTVSYTYAPEYQDIFPRYTDFRGWMLLRDFNCDGLEDIFAYTPAGMKVYKNRGNSTNGHSWELYMPLIYAEVFGQNINLYSTSNDFPSIEDMDGDGDLDIVANQVGGMTYYKYENVAPNCDTLIFVRENDCWGSFAESSSSDSIILNATCKGSGVNSANNNNRHANGSLLAIDLNGDSLCDLLLGDTESHNLTAIYNGGTPTYDHMTSVEYQYPTNTNSINLGEFVLPFYIDMNNDGVKDLIATPFSQFKSEDVNNSWYYRNNGTNNNVNFSYVRNNLINQWAVDLGTLAYPTFVDVDQDGLTDIFVGNYGYFQSYDANFVSTFLGQLAYYKNTGDSITPEFELQTMDYNNLSQDSLDGFFSTFGDIDGDGDIDMLVGQSNGSIAFYENTANSGSNPQFVQQTTNFMQINDGPMSSPKLFDVNQDGLLDLVIGNSNGTLSLHLNSGSSTIPVFNSNADNSSFGDIQVYDPYLQLNFISIDFASIDSTDSTYCFVGTGSGSVNVYRYNQNQLLSGSFNLIKTIRSNGRMATPSLANINFTESLEMIVGDGGGGFSLFSLEYDGPGVPPDTTGGGNGGGDTGGGSDTDSVNIGFIELKLLNDVSIFPNPTQDELNVVFNSSKSAIVNYQLTDLSGKSIFVGKWAIKPGEPTQQKIDVHAISDGVYLLVIQSGSEQTVKKVIKN